MRLCHHGQTGFIALVGNKATYVNYVLFQRSLQEKSFSGLGRVFQQMIQSQVSLIIKGIKLKDDITIAHTIHDEYISNIACNKISDEEISIRATIISEDKNKNYLIACDFRDFILRVFCIFGSSVELKDFKVEPDTDYLLGYLKIGIPNNEISEAEVNKQIELILKASSDIEIMDLFYNLYESQQSVHIIHRFRTLFAVFDRLAPKNNRYHIDYHNKNLLNTVRREIEKTYKDGNLTRYISIIEKFTSANLIDERAKNSKGKNYSEELKDSFSKLKLKEKIIEDNVSFYLMKCIQIIRNKVNHGDYFNLDIAVISGAYELLLPIVKALLCKKCESKKMGKVVCIIQARMGSTRLPGKVLMEVEGKPLLEHIIDRIKGVKNIDQIIIATSNKPADRQIVEFGNKLSICVFTGSEDDVLARFYYAARKAGAAIVIRITADCPVIDPKIIEEMVDIFKQKKDLDYYSNTLVRRFPRGLDVEIFTFEALQRAFFNAANDYEREHVTPYFYENPDLFKCGNYDTDTDYSHYRWTVDTPEDFQVIKIIYQKLYTGKRIFLMKDILNLFAEMPELYEINRHIEQKKLKC